MKRFLAIILVGLMLLTLVACGGKYDVAKFGVLEADGMEDMHSGAHHEHMCQGEEIKAEWIPYNNLSSALMDLENGKIEFLGVNEYTANYVEAHNKNIIAEEASRGPVSTHFSMMTMNSNKEVYDILNNAIKTMKEDGTLTRLIENDLEAYISSDPEPKDLPHFEGAQTIKIGITGDMPPMDFVASNGKAAGFNIALLTEIANRAQVNIELVQIETASRAIALSSNKVDAVFWTKSVTCSECNGKWSEVVEGTLVTESYLSVATLGVTKSDK
jgi:hypothetical protein